MQDIKIQLTQPLSKYFKIVQLLLGMVFVFQGVLNVFNNIVLSFVFGCWGLLIIIFIVFIEHRIKYAYLNVNEIGIGGKFSFFQKEVLLTWDNISEVAIKLLSINIFTRGGNSYIAKLDDLTYDQIKNLKAQLTQVLTDKNLLGN